MAAKFMFLSFLAVPVLLSVYVWINRDAKAEAGHMASLAIAAALASWALWVTSALVFVIARSLVVWE